MDRTSLDTACAIINHIKKTFTPSSNYYPKSVSASSTLEVLLKVQDQPKDNADSDMRKCLKF